MPEDVQLDAVPLLAVMPSGDRAGELGYYHDLEPGTRRMWRMGSKGLNQHYVVCQRRLPRVLQVRSVGGGVDGALLRQTRVLRSELLTPKEDRR